MQTSTTEQTSAGRPNFAAVGATTPNFSLARARTVSRRIRIALVAAPARCPSDFSTEINRTMPAWPNLIAPRATLSSWSQIAWAPDPARDPSHFINRIIRTRAARLNLIAVRAATPSCSRGRSHFTCDGAGELSDSAGRLDDAVHAELA